jgi:membrane-associated protein
MLDAHTVVQSGGILAIAAVIFAECGLLVGLFLPGDTLLLTAGLFAGQGKLPLLPLLLMVIIAGTAGYETGYLLGQRAGPKVFKRKNGLLLREDYIGQTEEFFKKHGAIAIVVARFIAHVRTLVPVIAGAGSMDRRRFFITNLAGAVLWGSGVTMLGYGLGSQIPNVDKYFFPALVLGLVLIYTVTLWSLAKSPERRKTIRKGLKEDFDYYFRHKG